MKKYIVITVTIFLTFILVSCKKELLNDKSHYERVKINHTVSKFQTMDGKNEVFKRVEMTEEFYIEPKKVITFSLGVADTFNYFGLSKLGIQTFGIPKDQTSLPNMLKEFNDKKYYDVGTLFEPDFSMIELINPDLIILDGRTAKYYEKLKKDYQYINVLDASLTTYEVVEQEKVFNNLSKIFPQIEEELNDFIELFKSKFSLIEEQTRNYSAMLLQLNGKLISAAVSNKGRYGLLYKEFGFKFKKISGLNLENSHGTAEISKESIKKVNPEVIFIMDRNLIVEGVKSDDTFLKEDLLKDVDAIKDNYVYYLNPESWYTISGGINATNNMIDDIMLFISDIDRKSVV